MRRSVAQSDTPVAENDTPVAQSDTTLCSAERHKETKERIGKRGFKETKSQPQKNFCGCAAPPAQPPPPEQTQNFCFPDFEGETSLEVLRALGFGDFMAKKLSRHPKEVITAWVRYAQALGVEDIGGFVGLRLMRGEPLPEEVMNAGNGRGEGC